MRRSLSILLQCACAVLPWSLRRPVLQRALGFRLAPDARIGYSLVLSDEVALGAGARIGHLTLIKGTQRLQLDDFSSIGHLNWITAFPAHSGSAHFADQPSREPSLSLGAHAAITNRHLIDCTDRIAIGAFSTFAGFRSQILTHSIDLRESRQRAKPVTIGRYCFVGTGSILLGGAALPDHSVLGAGSVLTQRFETPYTLYAGAPARAVKALDPALGYFRRTTGFVV